MRYNRAKQLARYRGLILVDVALAVVILGLGVVALMGFMGRSSAANAALSDNYKAAAIANAALEWGSNPANLDATNRSTLFTGNPATYSPSFLLDAGGEQLGGYTPAGTWTEVLTLRRVAEDDLTAADATDTSSMWEMTVTVRKNNKPILSMIRLYTL